MPVTHERDIDRTERENGETGFRRKQLGEAAEGERLGCSLYELQSGRNSWPCHYHTANEEATHLLAGDSPGTTGRYTSSRRGVTPPFGPTSPAVTG
ncbi:MAG: putative cupin superfamily protein [Halovenus sp.]|jgi:uncharacterized cupin superfamily protein